MAQATTYKFTGLSYSIGTITNFTAPCAVGPCANYTDAMSISGQLTTVAPLPANLGSFTEISQLVTSFRFTDGINTYSSNDPNLRRIGFAVATDASGNIVEPGGTFIRLQLWLTGTAPHTTNDRSAFLIIGGLDDTAWNNSPCPQVEAGPSDSGDSDWCSSVGNTDESSSVASGLDFFGTWSIDYTSAPALSEWSLILLFALLSSIGIWSLRRSQSL